MPQCVVRPLLDPGVLQRSSEPPSISADRGANWSGKFSVRSKPCHEIVRNRYQAPLCGLCLRGLHLDVTALKVNLLPVQTGNLCRSKPSKKPDDYRREKCPPDKPQEAL
jgi:hypothetical protein